MKKQTNLTALERFMAGKGGALIAYTMGVIFVLLVGWSLLELMGLIGESSHRIPMQFRVLVVLFTPALIRSYQRCRKKAGSPGDKQVSK